MYVSVYASECVLIVFVVMFVVVVRLFVLNSLNLISETLVVIY